MRAVNLAPKITFEKTSKLEKKKKRNVTSEGRRLKFVQQQTSLIGKGFSADHEM